MLETSPIEVYKQRATTAKIGIGICGIPYSDVKKIILQHYPEYNTAEGGDLITSVWNKRKADVKLTEILEQIATGKLKLSKTKKAK